MSDLSTRRTVALHNGTKMNLENIKVKTGATTDNAAINEAVDFRAQLIDTDINSIEDAIEFKKRLSKWKREEILFALSVYDTLKSELDSGNSIFIESPGNPGSRTKILVPSLG